MLSQQDGQSTEQCLPQERQRLMAMAEDHAAKLADPSEAPRLGALFAAGRLDGNHQDKLLALQVPPLRAEHTL